MKASPLPVRITTRLELSSPIAWSRGDVGPSHRPPGNAQPSELPAGPGRRRRRRPIASRRARVPIRPTGQCRGNRVYKIQPACTASGNPLRATTINDCAKLGTARGGTPTIVGRLQALAMLRACSRCCSRRGAVRAVHRETRAGDGLPGARDEGVFVPVSDPGQS